MRFNITILGCSSAMPSPARHHSAQVLNIHEQLYLIDCGEGTQYQLRRYDIPMLKINHIFISHLHGDHTYGLFGLLSSMSMLDRKSTLTIYAPSRLREMLLSHFEFYGIELPYPLSFVDVDSRSYSLIMENKTIEVYSIPLRHRIPTCGYLFREKSPALNVHKEAIERYNLGLEQIVSAKRGEAIETDTGGIIPSSELTYLPYRPRSYAYCSDTTASGRVRELVQGVDLLYHESTYMHQNKELALKTGHTTAKQAARLASVAGVGGLILGHYSSRYKDLQLLLDEALAEFPNTVLGVDGLQKEIAICKEYDLR